MQTAKIFNNGRSQAVRLPKDFRFSGSDVFIKKIGKLVVLLPKDDPWSVLVNSLDQFTDDFMDSRDTRLIAVTKGLINCTSMPISDVPIICRIQNFPAACLVQKFFVKASQCVG